MPGVATKFIVAERVRDRLIADQADERRFFEDAALRPFTYLGVAGSALGDFMASRPEVADAEPNSPFTRVWLRILPFFAGRNSGPGGTPAATTGVYRPLQRILATLAKFEDVVKRESTLDALGMLDELRAMTAEMNNIRNSVADLQSVRMDILTAIRDCRPREKVPPSNGWRVRDTLRGSRTGRFARALHEVAAKPAVPQADGTLTPDARLQAYAFGWRIAMAAELCGAPFVNSVVGAPYRNQWWRHRWVASHIDAWVYGFYRKGGGQSVNVRPAGSAAPAYPTWDEVQEARLHENIAMGGIAAEPLFDGVRDGAAFAAVLPAEFVEFWKSAYEQTYGASPAVDAEGIQSAYSMLWLTLWLQTANEALPGIAADRINPPDGCGNRPDWVAVDGSVADGSTPIAPPPDPPRPRPDFAEAISGILLALLGALATMGGSVVAGFLAMIGGVEVAIEGAANIDWPAMRCHLGWVRVFLNGLLLSFHDLLSWSGLGHPHVRDLGHRPFATPPEPDSALSTAFSRPIGGFPGAVWPATASDWSGFPASGAEAPPTVSYPAVGEYPLHFVDGLRFTSATTPPTQSNALAESGGLPLVRNKKEWEARRGRVAEAMPARVFFGNAVDVARALIGTAPGDLLDWDLDGDAGIGHPTWELPAPGAPRSASVPEP